MNCVLITLSYPYGNGDPFLKEEIPEISRLFEHIYILPMYEVGGQEDTLPDNAELIHSNSGKIRAILKTMAAIGRIISEVRFGRRAGYTNTIKMLHRVLVYEYKYNSVIHTLSKFSVNNCIFYSYWLAEPAYLLARYKMKNPDAVCISRTHGYDCFKDRGYNPFRREIAENIDCIYSISEKGKEDLAANLVLLARNNHQAELKVSHLGVKTGDVMNPDSEEDSVFRIVSCSNVVPIKRLDLLVETIRIVKNRKQVEWVHFGGGELLEQIRKEAKSVDEAGSKHIVFAGMTAHDDILKYYQSTHIDLFINCSDAEGIPVAMMEAMEYGIPCIGRDVGGISELIDNGVNGFLLSAETDSQILAAKIEELMINGIGQEIRKNAREKILSEFSNQKNYTQFAQEIMKRIKD